MLSQFHTCADKFEFPFNEDQMTYCSKSEQVGIGILCAYGINLAQHLLCLCGVEITLPLIMP